MQLNEDYQKKLDTLRNKMEKAQAFANRIPGLEDHILNGMFSGEENNVSFGKHYKNLYLGWGIRRVFFGKNDNTSITNYVGEKPDKHLFSIYINTLTMYDSHEKWGISEIPNKVDVFFFDRSNTTFYATDEQIVPLLDALNDWYLNAVEEERKLREQEEMFRKQEEFEKLKRELGK